MGIRRIEMAEETQKQTSGNEHFASQFFSEQLDQAESMVEEFGKFQERAFDDAGKGIEEMADIARASLDYQHRLFSTWSKMSLQFMHQATQAMRGGLWPNFGRGEN
jgi:hypothetical protein